ncbi:HNH endonuclease signature motif containing protein [Microbacterium jiangjiandongii]|uniref:HNH endonuclease signature motif containing protein n=1 Tax=Microbacterium jiangjiandongii TaxID=3049071 RepID=UPI00214C8820|nr:HNH endonuclease signature motif containing protein [Microbacterium sp. zg.Y843]MCR2814700.1 HNH endonuclease [Microbacterium sp. zg.Y843]
MSSSPAATTRRDTRSRGAVLSELERTRARIAALQAEELGLLARADAIAAEHTARVPSSAGREREMPLREMAADVATVMRRSDRVIQDRMHDATVLVTGFAATVAALRAGAIDTAHVRIIQDAGARITDPDARARFEQAALVVCERETPGRAKPIIAMIGQKLHPVPLAERHAEAAAGRRVWVRDLDDGMAELAAVLPAVLAYAIRDRLTQHAREVAAAQRAAAPEKPTGSDGATAETGDDTGSASTAPAHPAVERPADNDPGVTDTRTADQVRADVLTDLLLTGHASTPVSSSSIPAGQAITAHVQIVIPAATLTGEGTAPAELIGYGPIDPDTARHLAGTADLWERVFTSPTTGAVQHVDTYRPNRAQRRHLDARDEHCRFPGCRRPVYYCDHDHTLDHARGGPTDVCNLANLCVRHHTLKHASAWTVTQKADGILEWTSPTGRIHLDIPRRVLEFTALTAAEDPPPF